jgi:hypothetical protein
MARPRKAVFVAPEPEIVSTLTTSEPASVLIPFVIPVDGEAMMNIYTNGKLVASYQRGVELELTLEQIAQIKQFIPA